jgi:hypothetical protein
MTEPDGWNDFHRDVLKCDDEEECRVSMSALMSRAKRWESHNIVGRCPLMLMPLTFHDEIPKLDELS